MLKSILRNPSWELREHNTQKNLPKPAGACIMTTQHNTTTHFCCAALLALLNTLLTATCLVNQTTNHLREPLRSILLNFTLSLASSRKIWVKLTKNGWKWIRQPLCIASSYFREWIWRLQKQKYGKTELQLLPVYRYTHELLQNPCCAHGYHHMGSFRPLFSTRHGWRRGMYFGCLIPWVPRCFSTEEVETADRRVEVEGPIGFTIGFHNHGEGPY